MAPVVDDLIALAKRYPDAFFDPDPTNDESIEDEGTIAGSLSYVTGYLEGQQGNPRVCSRKLAARSRAALKEIGY